ncbi:hypothetical protein DPMN_164118 [Dreissena polymorpha]|uniref:Uncharacterized protein n=1 Tax=Dreissena polymorpha TaxID=45954 RepID=A0A9D4IV34_DREPO|nr:hypothetical protein DPMN_164118 [Dreissena polymorpha]
MDRIALLCLLLAFLMSVVSVSEGSMWKCCGNCRRLAQQCIRFGKNSCRCRGKMAIIAKSAYPVHGNGDIFERQKSKLSMSDRVLLDEKL